jgi:Rad3-related DNA helicase
MDFFRERLGLPVSSFQERFPSTILQEQRPVWIVPSINTAYSSRQKSSADLAALIEEAAEVSSPANIAVFFPSFAYLEMVLRCLRPDLDRRMLVQTPSMDKEERDQILEALRSRERGHLLMGVLGGIFAEGIDYKDTMLEGVIVVGPGLPAVGPERETLRRYYQDLGMDGFTAAYAIPGIQRVLQAVGRLIRSESDRGFALLVGRRFQRPPYWGLLPPEWRALGSNRLTSPDWPDVIRGFSEAFFREPAGHEDKGCEGHQDQSGSESPES